MKMLFYAVAALGILVMIAGLVLKLTHQAHGLSALGVGVVILVIGVACSIFVKPKATTAA